MSNIDRLKEVENNYSFLLKCMAAITAAIATAAIITLASLKSTAAASIAIAAKTAFVSSFIVAPPAPLALVAIGIAFLCIFSCGTNSNTTARFSNFGPYNFFPTPSTYYTSSVYHGHPSPAYPDRYPTNPGNAHGHPSSGGNVHGHGGSGGHNHGHR